MTQPAVPDETPQLAGPLGTKPFVDGYLSARTNYWRASHDERLNMLFYQFQSGSGDDEEHLGAYAAVFRQAWETEPYVDDVRHGTMFSLLERVLPDYCNPETTNEALASFGRLMMYENEHDLLNAMQFPRTVYRGGAGCEDDVRRGRSWTFDFATACFFAKVWPKRWGHPGEPLVLQMEIERADVMAYLNDRQEDEVVLVGGQGTDRTRCIRVQHLE